jgi:hypothetical protein
LFKQGGGEENKHNRPEIIKRLCLLCRKQVISFEKNNIIKEWIKQTQQRGAEQVFFCDFF